MMEAENNKHVEGSVAMTPLQNAYIGKLMATYEANLYFVQKFFPKLFKKIIDAQPTVPFIVTVDGDVEITYGKFRGGFRAYIDYQRALYAAFDNVSTRNVISVSGDYLDDPAKAFPHAETPHLFYRMIEPQYRGELISHFNGVISSDLRTKEPLFDNKQIPLLIAIGTGYGWHLERVVDEYEILNILIIDTDILRMNMSMYFVDYVSLYQRFAKVGNTFILGCDESVEDLVSDMLVSLYNNCPPYFVQGAALLVERTESEKSDQIKSLLLKDLYKMYRGWGFLDDEIIGLKQAAENIKKRHPLFSGKIESMPEDAVAFVVGAGPSLDHLLPLMAKYKDNAVIIGCGTGSSALYSAGITPDFHLEIERTSYTFEVLSTPAFSAWIKNVPILASAIMAPGVFDLGKEAYIFLKQLDFGSNMVDFMQKFPRVRTNPTCTNGGLDFVLRVGFKYVYLFGVDVGFRDNTYHHSKKSIYFEDTLQDESSLDTIAFARRMAEQQLGTCQKVKANFEEQEVFSTQDLIYCRDSHQICISEHPGARVFNLNDGAYIAGAIPQRPEDVVIENSNDSKMRAISAIKDSFVVDYGSDFLLNIRDLGDQIDAVIADLRLWVPRESITGKFSAINALASMHSYFSDPRHQEAQVYPLFRGSLMHLGRFAYDCISRIKDDEAAAEFGKYTFDLFERFLESAKENVQHIQGLFAEEI